jgi:hypothetical protein
MIAGRTALIKEYEIAVLWEWDYDRPFNELLALVAREYAIRVLFVDPSNLDTVHAAVREGAVRCKWFLDRASETDPVFLPFVETCMERGVKPVNPPRSVSRALNKARMHRVLFRRGCPLPETLVLPSRQDRPRLPFFDFSSIGIPFVVKPANGGGGDGVHVGLTERSQVDLCRNEFPDQEYLVQQLILPLYRGNRPLWFRVYHVMGAVWPSFWNPRSKRFAVVQEGDLEPALLEEIRSLSLRVARASRLRFFSSEFAVDIQGETVIIDYVNDPIDLRPESLHPDGIPNLLFEGIVRSFLDFFRPSGPSLPPRGVGRKKRK